MSGDDHFECCENEMRQRLVRQSAPAANEIPSASLDDERDLHRRR